MWYFCIISVIPIANTALALLWVPPLYCPCSVLFLFSDILLSFTHLWSSSARVNTVLSLFSAVLVKCLCCIFMQPKAKVSDYKSWPRLSQQMWMTCKYCFSHGQISLNNFCVVCLLNLWDNFWYPLIAIRLERGGGEHKKPQEKSTEDCFYFFVGLRMGRLEYTILYCMFTWALISHVVTWSAINDCFHFPFKILSYIQTLSSGRKSNIFFLPIADPLFLPFIFLGMSWNSYLLPSNCPSVVCLFMLSE